MGIIAASVTASTLSPATTFAASAATVTAVPLTASAQAAAANASKQVVKVTSKGLGIQVTADYADSCTTGGVRIEFDASATRDTSASPQKTATSQVLLYIYGWNSCTQTDVYNVTYADIPYSVQEISGRTLPTNLTISGQNLPNSFGTDTISFQLTIADTGPLYTQINDDWQIYQASSTSPATRIHTTRTGSQANVTGGTLTVSTQQMGVIPISNAPTGVMFDSQGGVVTITH
ncbi:hypothetical protein CBA19CS91_26655 [Paraburkholderia hospita]|nr:hypothetical protein CBA19CS91_26655 [Paraburkholderia hospita]